MSKSPADPRTEPDDEAAPKSFMETLMTQVIGLLEDDEPDHGVPAGPPVGHQAEKAAGDS